MVAVSSTIQSFPITMAPSSANIDALGCTTVPGPTVISPRRSASWQIAAEGCAEILGLRLSQHVPRVGWKTDSVPRRRARHVRP